MKLFLVLVLLASTAQAKVAEKKNSKEEAAVIGQSQKVSTEQGVVTELSQKAPRGQVEFEAIGRPSMIKIKGKSSALESQFKVEKGLLSGESKINLDTFTTGIEMRDTHMKEKYLEVANYPQAILKIENLKLPQAWSAKNPQLKDFPFVGKLTLHNVEKEVTGVLNTEAGKLKTKANFEVAISDYKIELPSYLGIKVADKVKVAVDIEELTVQEK